METIVFFTKTTAVRDNVFQYELKNRPTADCVAVIEPVNDQKQIIFAFDEIQEQNFDQLLNRIGAGKCYLIYHSAKFELDKLLPRLAASGIHCPQRNQLRSSHIDPKTYRRIPEIEENSGHPVILEKIFDQIVKQITCAPNQSKKVNPVHECLDPAKAHKMPINDDRLPLRVVKQQSRTAQGLFDPAYRSRLILTIKEWFSE